MQHEGGEGLQARIAARPGLRRVFIDQLRIETVVGVYEHEKQAAQTVFISLDIGVPESGPAQSDDLGDVVCYGEIVERVKAVCNEGHRNLIETLAERIAEAIFEDGRIEALMVRIEKPEAFSDCHSVGIEIVRMRNDFEASSTSK